MEADVVRIKRDKTKVFNGLFQPNEDECIMAIGKPGQLDTLYDGCKVGQGGCVLVLTTWKNYGTDVEVPLG